MFYNHFNQEKPLKIQKSNRLMALADHMRWGPMTETASNLRRQEPFSTWLENLAENIYMDGAELSFDEACGLMCLFCVMKTEDSTIDGERLFFRTVDGRVHLIGMGELDDLTQDKFPEMMTFEDLDEEQEKRVLDENNIQNFSIGDFIDELIVSCGGDLAKIS